LPNSIGNAGCITARKWDRYRTLAREHVALQHSDAGGVHIGRPTLSPMNVRQMHEVAIAGNYAAAEKVTENLTNIKASLQPHVRSTASFMCYRPCKSVNPDGFVQANHSRSLVACAFVILRGKQYRTVHVLTRRARMRAIRRDHGVRAVGARVRGLVRPSLGRY
jgi:hypothetical protein